MFCVAVCDDEKEICLEIKSYLETYIESDTVEVKLFTSGEKLYETISVGKHFDLIFLDIELKLLNGVTVGKKIRKELYDESTHIVFISGKPEYALELFSIHPLHFLVKPFTQQQIVDVLKKAMRLAVIYQDFFEFKIAANYYKIRYGDIWYFESNGRKTILYTQKDKYEFYAKLNDVEQMTESHFLRIHQSYLVNPLFINRYEYNKVYLINSFILPISESYRLFVKKEILKNWERI